MTDQRTSPSRSGSIEARPHPIVRLPLAATAASELRGASGPIGAA